MGIGTVTSTGIQVYVGGCHVEGCQAINPNNSHQNLLPGKENIVESNFTLVNAASAFGTGALLAHPTNVSPFSPRLAAIETMHRSGHGVDHQNVHEKVADGMGVAAGAAVVAAGLIAFAKSCVSVASGVAASVLLVTKQSLDAARPTTATPDL